MISRYGDRRLTQRGHNGVRKSPDATQAFGHISVMANKTYGTVSSEQQNAMTGLEFVQGLANGTLPLNTIARTLGYDIVEAEAGRVVITAEPSDAHLNPAGTVHGGLSATLLDSCMGLAVRSMLGKGINSTTIEFKMSFARPITRRSAPSAPRAGW